MKKYLLSIIMLALPILASAYDCKVGGIYYNIKSGKKAEVTSGDKKYSGALSIPQKFTYNNVEYTVTSIGEYAFINCSGLTSITIPNSVTNIGDAAFVGCSNLNSVTIPSSVTNIGVGSFMGCRSLTSIKVESGNTQYDSRNNCNAIIETNTNTLIAGCKNTVIPNSVTSIGEAAFRLCSGLTSVTIPNSVTSIGESAFSECSSLTSLTIPNSVTSIGELAFSYCTGLPSITIPNSVTSIGEYAFGNCTGLKEIICLFTKPMAISEGTFYGSYSSAKLTVPYGTKDAFKSTDYWSKFTNIVEAAPEDAVTITANSYTITYGDPLPTFGYTTTGSALQGTPTITCSATSSSGVGTYDIIVSKGSVSNSSITYVKGTLTIKKATLTASAGNYSRKQGEANPTFTITYSGFKNGETKSVLTREPTVACSATAASAPGTYPITLSGGEARNYDFNYQNGTLTVTAADAVVVTANDYTITYGDALPTFEYTVTGGTYDGTPKITCSATSSSDAGTYDINIAAGSGTNYNVTYVKGKLTIKKATLTASVGNYTRKQGEANPTFNITYSGFKNGENKNVLTKEPTASCSATAASAPGSYPITLSGGQATNYEFSYKNGTLTVTAADAVTITANSYTITYGDALPTFEYTVSGGTYDGTPKITCSANSSSDAGTYDINIAAGTGTNYNVTFVKGTLTIKKATLTASVGNYTRKQGEANPTFTITYNGFKNGESKSVLTREPSATCSATATSDPGTYPITLSGGEAKNYSFNYENGTLTVTAADAVVVTANNYTITYGDALPAFEYTVSGGTYDGTPKITCSANSSSDAGTYDINIAAGTGTNYNVTFVKGTLTIKKATLTASVGNYSRKQGEANPKFNITYSGFKKNQTKSVLTREPSATCSATAASDPGTYPITLSGGEARNYDFSYQNGVLTVEPRDAVTITANSYTITYGDPLPDFAYTTAGAELRGTPTIKCSATSKSDVGTYTITVSKGSVSNEDVTLVNGTLTITKAVLTASAGNYTKKQGDEMPAFSISYSGFKNGETKSVLTKEPTVSCSATAASAPGSYPVTLSGGQATNYEFKYQNGTLTVIAADAAAVTAKSYTITYGDPLPQFEYETSGVGLDGTPAISCSANSDSDAGTYDIVVSKGSVSNYNVSYVNGTLTIRKAVLTASVGEYTRKPGEDNPKFSITYSGFKKNQTKSVLDSEPTASCDATKDSPSGTYLITLSGGSARNYDFKYENGVLRVLNGYTLSIMSIGKGSVVFGNETVSQNNSLSTTVFPDEQYTVTFRPDKGYKLGKLLWNDKDVLVDIVNNTYTISNVSQNCTLIAMYEESLGEFTANGITYEILSSSENTVAVTKGNYTGQIEIPATVTDNGIKWSVVGIQNFAFSNTPIITAVIPESVRESSMGGGIFSGCQALAAITWNAGFAMTGNVLSGLSNPNLLFYTKNASYAPSGVKNVVVNGTAEEITLTDAEGSSNFYCPTEFTARKISYTHNYTMTSGFGGKAQGWETLALPFDVKEISHEAKGDILPFAAWNSSSPARPFWLYGLSAGGFSRASSILANTPYIICMPNNEEYDTDYILAGAVTFSATDAKVKASSALIPGKSGTKTFTPAFCAQEKSNGVYVLNVNNDLHRELGGYDEGSRFVSNLRTAGPFEAYMTDSSAGAKQAIGIEFSDATGIDELLTGTDGGGQMNTVYTLSGQLVVRTCSVQEMLKALEQLPEGVYIVNGKKKHIK